MKNLDIVINESNATGSYLSTILKYIHLFLQVKTAVVFDLVELDITCACRETISFATIDAIILIASINAASRAESVQDAIPLLVGFDFIKDFPARILKQFEIKDDDALAAYETLRTSMSSDRSKLTWYLRAPIVVMFNIISIGI